ncbi:protein Shroom3 isoform X3 [Dromiciops gliroides]|uniref:protein Shroom3 isoform X3 n=1 Tax=Dromiciops gliroides TaxID=33562 RepID=UPI001CC4023B|nr:protein Shroom3 isoform X3 [Dromiciops gliroides]
MALGKEDCLALVLSRLGSQIRGRRRNVNADADQKPEVSPPHSPGSFTPDFQHRIATDGGIQLILRNRCSEPVSQPHSWHSTKSGEDKPDASMMQISQGTIGTPWHQNYHSSSSTSDVSNYSHAYPRRSPDQYSSQGSMESLDHSGGYPPCHLLSPAKSTSSIDQLTHLHNKRDSAYSSFSTSSSILEYPPTSFSAQECSDTVATTPAQGSLLEGMKQADIRYVKTVYDTRRGVSAEYEVNSSALLLPTGESQESADGRDYDGWHNHPRGGRTPLLSWNQEYCRSHETKSNSLPHKVGAPMPPTRSGSYAVLRHYERSSSCSSLEYSRCGRPHSGFPGSLKTSFPEEHLHPLLEKSPESSPPVKPKQNYGQASQPGQPLLPTGIYPVPSPEPHFAQMPQPSVSSNGMVYPALVKECSYTATLSTCDKGAHLENGNQNGPSKSAAIFYQAPEYISPPPVEKPEATVKFSPYKPHFISESENIRGTSLRKDELQISEGNSVLSNGRESMHESVQHSNHHIPQTLQIQVQEANEGQVLCRPSEPRRAEFQESQNARLQPRPEREDSWSTSGKTNSSFLSRQTISESTRKQESLDLPMGPQEGNPDSRINVSPMEQEPQKTVLEQWDHSDWQASHVRTEGGTKGSPPFHNSQPRHEAHRQTSSLNRRRLSSGNTLQTSHYGKPNCSVLEKVSKIEQREQRNRRPLSVSSYIYRASKLEHTPGSGSSMIGLEDPQDEISFSEAGSSISSGSTGENLVKEGKKKPEGVSWHLPEHQPRRVGNGGRAHPETKPLRSGPLLQRSQSTFQLSNKVEEETLWRGGRPTSPESPLLEVPLNQAYRNSIKDAQSRVLGATSFQRRDLDLGPPVVSQSRRGARQRPASAHLGMRSPEVTVMSASPHIPKERHSITPTEGSPPREDAAALVARVGGRKRLTAEQKKRSYSEPEKMNEVGVSGAGEPAACCPQRKDLPFGFPENTVADRRRIFEREGKACSTLNLSRPELKQLQQTALADYIQRKTGKRPSSSVNHGRESRSLTSVSSVNSLQEQIPFSRRGSATLPPELVGNLDRHSLETRSMPRDRSSSFANGHLRAERYWHPRREPAQADWLGEAGDQLSHPQKVTWALDKHSALVTVTKRAGKSMSAEDLLDRSDVLTVPCHSRSRSSPISDKKCQDVLLRGNSDYSLLGKSPSCTAGPGSSNSIRLSELTITDTQRSSPTPASRPNPFIKVPGAKQTSLLSTPNAQNQPIETLGERSSPEQMLPTQASSLIQKLGDLTQESEKGSPSSEKTPEDIRRETLAKQIVHQDKSLAGILDPDSRMKTTMDLMEGLFPQGPSFLKENNMRKKAIQRNTSFPVSEGSRGPEKERAGMLINCPAYYNVSAPKAELLNKLKSMPIEGNEDDDHLDVNEKKAKLIGSLRLKLESLKEAKESLLMDIKLNNALGEDVEVLISKLCKPNEFDKYKMFIGDLDKVVNLLLSLSGRLARVENVLSGLGEDADSQERSSLNEKRKVLAGQHEDARELKENLDRRERVVLDILANYLTKEQFQDYQHFVKMKSTLLIEQRKLDDKIKLGQEQLNCLLESLPRDFLSKARAPAALPPPEAEVPSNGGCTFRSTLTSSL